MIDALQSLSRVGNALDCARSADPKYRPQHLEAAILAAGDLQRALILARLRLDRPARTAVRTIALLLLATLASAADWVPVEVIATAYCPCSICCGSRAIGITADGTDTREAPYGVATGDTDLLPYGSAIWIPAGNGYLDSSRSDIEQRVFSIDDTGGKLRTDTRETGILHIDLRYRYHGSARRFGRKSLTIYVWR